MSNVYRNSIVNANMNVENNPISIWDFRSKIYPVLYELLDRMSASDCSSFLYATATRLDYEYMHKYLNIVRDIPEYEDWITTMIEKGCKVLLIGSDVSRLRYRIMHPQLYDRRNEIPLCIWLAVVPVNEVMHNQVNEYWNHYVTMLGYESPILLGDTNNCPFDDMELVMREAGYSSSVTHPRATMFIYPYKSLYMFTPTNGSTSYYSSTLENTNNIKIVFPTSKKQMIGDYGLSISLDLMVKMKMTRTYGMNRHIDEMRINSLIKMYNTITGIDPKHETDTALPLINSHRVCNSMTNFPYEMPWYNVNKDSYGMSDVVTYTSRPDQRHGVVNIVIYTTRVLHSFGLKESYTTVPVI
ncbi:hypothetical protein MY10362_009156 [Beauveria mimosiformis]